MLFSFLKNIGRGFAKKPNTGSTTVEWDDLAVVVQAYNDREFQLVAEKCRATLALQPRHALANLFCARALAALGQADSARAHLDAALEGDPDMAEARFDLSAILQRSGDLPGAEQHARRAVELMPSEWRYRVRLADVLEEAGRQEESLEQLAFAQEFGPDRFDVLQRLMRKLDQIGKYELALRIAERAMQENGETYETQFFLGYARFVTGDHEGAVAACRRAIAIRGNEPGVHVTLGSSLMALGRLDEATSAFKRSLRILPDHSDAVFHLGMLNLMRARYRDGWTGFEYRFKGPRSTRRSCEPRWNGTNLRGRVLHIMREQGLGDDIMYSSCYGQLIDEAKQCVIECEPRLLKLFQRSFPKGNFYPIVDNPTKSETLDIDGVDVRIFSASIPGYLRNSHRDFPEHQGYLKADPARMDYWGSRLTALGPGIKVGLSWRGGTVWTHSRRRNLSLDRLLPVLKLPNVQWVNLQYGDRAGELDALRQTHGITVADWSEAIDGDYDETAALVSQLDLVISVCTSVIHLGGALGRPVWVMVPFAPEWRYGATGEKMPWYSSVSLYRQSDPQDWDTVISRVAADLSARLSGMAP